MDDRLDIGGWARGVEGLGPGKRAILWVRGCDLACPGCMTPELWQNAPRERWRSIESVAGDLERALEGMDGLTVSGGEPTSQAPALTLLIEHLRRSRDVEVVVYSGHVLEELCEREEILPLLAAIDILIDGRFQNESANTLQWRGSDNQRVHLLSERAQKYAEVCDALMPDQRDLGLQSLGTNNYRIVGIPKRGDLARYRQLMSARGLSVRPDL
ncbi:radical SAM protein [bacterium]|nr:MAG: radical SAM protein [bacterium]